MKKKYDVVIVGGGVGGLFAAYRLRSCGYNGSILIMEQGRMLEERQCPASNGQPCAHCSICAITSGLAGAGAFSDAKFNLGTSYGGTLADEIGEHFANQYIKQVDFILQQFCSGTYPSIYSSDEELKTECLKNNLRLLDMNVRHLGTDRNIVTMQNLINYIVQTVDISTQTRCRGIYKLQHEDEYRVQYCITHVSSTRKSEKLYTELKANKVIIATGRGGADLVKKVCDEFHIDADCNSVDIGVRVEMKDAIWRKFSSKIYEPKILCKTKTFEDNCRMFCFNQGGIVSAENNNGIITANGHSFADPEKKTDNCNFAILSSINFTEPFDQPTEYAENVSRMANMIGKGNVIVQRFGDLIRGRRTTDSRLKNNSVTPTLKATPGDISLVLPHRILTNIIETIYALDEVAPGTANDDTLLYGCESKYYSLKPKHDDTFCIHDGLYLIGDGSGISRGLSQSAAMGLWVADSMLNDPSV